MLSCKASGAGCGVGRGRGVTLGVALGVTLWASALGVTLGVTVGVALGVTLGVGVGLPPGQVPSTLYTICIIKPGILMPSVGVGSGNPQGSTELEVACAGLWRRIRSDKEVIACFYSIRVHDFHDQFKRAGRNAYRERLAR